MTLHDIDDVHNWATEQLDRRHNDPEYGDDTYDGAWLAGAAYTLRDLLGILDAPDAQ